MIGPPLLRLVFPFGLPDVPADYPEQLLATIWAGVGPGNRAGPTDV